MCYLPNNVSKSDDHNDLVMVAVWFHNSDDGDNDLVNGFIIVMMVTTIVISGVDGSEERQQW